MTAGKFHRPTPADKPNAFESIRHEAPSLFCTPKDIAMHNRKLGQISSKVRGVSRRNPLTDTKQQIVYSKARASR